MWGFLTSGILDTPDGSRSYRRSLVDAVSAAGHQVVFLQENRDLHEGGVDLRDAYGFSSGFPRLDALVLEWRWPLPGRNTTGCGTAGHTCDLHRQRELLEVYTFDRRTPTVVWDLDRRLPADDPLRRRGNVTVAEYALRPTPGAITVACPAPDRLLDAADPALLAARPRPVDLVYVGNQYDRDAAFGAWFAPAAAQVSHRVAGKWPRTSAWPHVRFTGRCRFGEVAAIHAGALATVLLLPERYARVGHQTSRLFEAVTAGCLPLTPSNTVCASAFTPDVLHVDDGAAVVERLRWLRAIAGTPEHEALIAACLAHLEQFRLTRQTEVLLNAVHALAGRSRPDDHAPAAPERTRAC
jgi:hypothetical protein